MHAYFEVNLGNFKISCIQLEKLIQKLNTNKPSQIKGMAKNGINRCVVNVNLSKKYLSF